MKDKIKNHFRNNFKSFFKKYLTDFKKIGGDGYKSICPFHDEKNASFNFNNKDGRYYCHGCGKKGDFLHFYGKINGLDTRHDFGKILRGISDDFGIPWEEKKSRIVKTYDYQDTDGNLFFQVCRMLPKDFRQRRPDGQGGWVWNLRGIEPILYKLPQILTADEVVIVEGEKDSDNLMELGFTATTSPMGAKKWRAEYNESLKGKQVVLIPDNDLEGKEHMTRVAQSLNGYAKSLKWLELPDLPSKGDVTDFISTFDNKEDAAERLSILIENAKPYIPPKKASIEDAIVEISQFCKLDLAERVEYLNPWVKEGSIGLISGWRGTGKTWFALGILDAISRGESFGAWKCKVSVPCLLLDGEMPTQDIIERSNSLGLTSDRQNPFYIYSDAHANHLGLPRAHLANESWRNKMKRILITRKVKLWVIDNLASLASGLDENTKKDWDPVNNWLLELRFAGISTIMLHHVSKYGAQRGTSSREDNLDASIILKAPHDYSPEDGARFIVRFTKARVKMNDLHLVADTEFKLLHDEHGKLIWAYGNVKREQRLEIIRMLDEGMKQIEISQILGISRGQVSKLRKKAIDEGYLTEKDKLTQEGFIEVSKD